jgi:predicted DNA binding CopG/RHH family protein
MEGRMMEQLPTTDSIKELAAFWQHHDVTDFEEDLEEVTEPVFQRRRVVGIPLTEDEHQAIRGAAAARGVDEGTLLREWVRERLRQAS